MEAQYAQQQDIALTASAGRTRQIAATMVGNALEYYDFVVYAFLATTLAQKFYQGDAAGGLLASFATFGVGFLTRPLGAVLIGRLADRRGRRVALQVTILGMAIGTVGIGLLPTYEQIGVVAPIALVTLRLIQGLAVGGEWGTATSFIVESAPSHRRGLFGALSHASVFCSNLLSNAVVACVVGSFTAAQLSDWGWRIPFLVGGALLPLGIYMRRNLHETPAFKRDSAQTTTEPVTSRSSAAKSVFRGFGMTIIWTVSTYTMLLYMPTFLSKHVGLTPSQALLANLTGLCILVLASPIFGFISDQIGRKPLLLTSCIAFLLLPFPAFDLLMKFHSFGAALVVQVVFSLLIAMYTGAAPAALCELFPTSSRTTLLSIGFSIATAVFGGFAPFIATALVAATGSATSPTYYLMASALFSGLTILPISETAKSDLR